MSCLLGTPGGATFSCMRPGSLKLLGHMGCASVEEPAKLVLALVHGTSSYSREKS